MQDFETHPVGTADLVKRLRQRADEDRAIQKNNEAVASALMGQRLLFDQGIRSNANTFAVRLGLDYENCAKKDAKLSQDWSDAADRIEQLEAALTRANAATAAAYEVAAQVINDRGAVEQENFGLDRATQNFFRARDLVRALATPDQTAALDKLIAEAEARAYQQASDTTWREAADIVLLQLIHDATCGEPVYMHNKRCYNAILAASKKGGV